MRRSLSILLLFVFGLGPLAPALPQHDHTSLPACCRRAGAHHCAMAAETQADSSPRIPVFARPSHCPLFPVRPSANLASFSALVRWPFRVAVKMQPAPAAAAQDFGTTDFNLCTFTLRGPPTLLPA